MPFVKIVNRFINDLLAIRNAAFIDRSVAWLASRFNMGAGTRIADFGCGPGLYVVRLARKQADWSRGIAELYRSADADGTFSYTFFKATGKKQ